jgi:hypothetical protein
MSPRLSALGSRRAPTEVLLVVPALLLLALSLAPTKSELALPTLPPTQEREEP